MHVRLPAELMLCTDADPSRWRGSQCSLSAHLPRASFTLTPHAHLTPLRSHDQALATLLVRLHHVTLSLVTYTHGIRCSWQMPAADADAKQAGVMIAAEKKGADNVDTLKVSARCCLAIWFWPCS